MDDPRILTRIGRVDTLRNVALPLSTAPSRKLAIGLPLLTPTSPVEPRPKLKVPAWLPLPWMLPMIFRYSIPTLSVCAPFVHVTASLMMKVGRVVTLPMLMPALLPELREAVAEGHLRRDVVAGHACDFREVVEEVLVDRPVALHCGSGSPSTCGSAASVRMMRS